LDKVSPMSIHQQYTHLQVQPTSQSSHCYQCIDESLSYSVYPVSKEVLIFSKSFLNIFATFRLRTVYQMAYPKEYLHRIVRAESPLDIAI
jgi:hypothetical protein